MKCKECGHEDWEVLVTAYHSFRLKDGTITREDVELGVASILYICKAELEPGHVCGSSEEETLNADEFELLKQEYGLVANELEEYGLS